MYPRAEMDQRRSGILVAVEAREFFNITLRDLGWRAFTPTARSLGDGSAGWGRGRTMTLPPGYDEAARENDESDKRPPTRSHAHVWLTYSG